MMRSRRTLGGSFWQAVVLPVSALCILLCGSRVRCDEPAAAKAAPQEEETADAEDAAPRVTRDDYPSALPEHMRNPDYMEDIAPGQHLFAEEFFLQPRFVRPGKTYGRIRDVTTRRRYDLLQQAVAPGIVKIDGRPADLILRWEISFVFQARSVMSLAEGKYDVRFAEEPEPWLTYTLLARTDDGNERELVPPTSADIWKGSTKVPSVVGNRRSNFYDVIGAGVLRMGVFETKSELVDGAGIWTGSAETASILFSWGFAPSVYEVYKESSTPWELEGQQRTLTSMLSRYIRHTTHPCPKDLLTHAEGWVPQWDYVPGGAFASAWVLYIARADDGVSVASRSPSTWCVYVPEEKEEIREMELSPLIARRTARYDDPMDQWLKPLLGMDLFQHSGTSQSRAEDTASKVGEPPPEE